MAQAGLRRRDRPWKAGWPRSPRSSPEVKRSVPALARLTDLEAATYEAGRFSTYFAGQGLITVFIDSTERSPTFRLYPLDTVARAEAEMLDPGLDRGAGRRGGLAGLPRPAVPRPRVRRSTGPPFEKEIDDAYLREKALDSLTRAGDDQAALYDFSFAGTNAARSGRRRRATWPCWP